MTNKKYKRTRNQLIILLIFLLLALSFKGILRSFFPIEYEDTIIKYSKEYNVDPNLIAAVIKAESKYNAKAQSPKGAMGLMQIMPETGDWIAETIGIENYNSEMLWDYETNIKMGTWYLSNLSEEFNGDILLVIAAYNGGSGNVTKWLQNVEYSQDGEILTDIPFKETKNYVRSVTQNNKIYKFLYHLEEK